MRLLEQHPDAFEEAKRYEKTAIEHRSPFTWSDGKSLEELSNSEQIRAIKAEHERRVERTKNKIQRNPLRSDHDPLDIDEIYGQTKLCLACHK